MSDEAEQRPKLSGSIGGTVWTPGTERVAKANLSAFVHQAAESGAVQAGAGMAELYRWSADDPEAFWAKVWRFCEVVAEPGDPTPWTAVGVGLDRMAPPEPELGPHWFPGARLNFAENLLRYRDERLALVSWTEKGRVASLTYAELAQQVASMAAALKEAGIGAGDRVAGYLPNVPEAVIAMLATASLGAIWSSCSPDFGVPGVLDRFGQIEPRVLFCADGYRYAGKEIDLLPRVREIAAAIPSIGRVVIVPYLRSERAAEAIPHGVSWGDLLRPHASATLEFARMPFDHPLYILYSSGTTGLPKCMVHGAGGTLLQHLKELVLHTDIRRDDRVFYFTTCGWMMWNWLVSALATGATVVLYDGAPMPVGEPDILWRMAASEGVTVFGTSARYLTMAEKGGVEPRTKHDLSALRTILSTGSPLGAESYDYVYSRVKQDVCLSSISGGTDIVSCFALGDPLGPVRKGEIQTRGLGMAIEIWDENGSPVIGTAGELVCTRPFPSMPVRFWNDPDGSRYRAAYFEHFPGVWRHGDWAELTHNGGVVIHGRSDATLNPGGVRIGTAEIYRQVERVADVIESVVVEQIAADGAGRIVLFVRLRDGRVLDEPMRDEIRRQIRSNASPHHVPRLIVQVADVPRTISGKITEVAVREVIHGRPVTNQDALANPEALELFKDMAELR